MVDLAIRMLQFVREHIKHMFALKLFGYQPLDMVEPPGRIALGRRWPGVAPSVAIDRAVHCCEDRLAGGIGDALQRPGALGLAVFVITDTGGNFRLALAMHRLARYMGKHRVERFAHNLAAFEHIEVRIVRHNISEALIPFGLLKPAHLFAVDLGDDGNRFIGKGGRR